MITDACDPELVQRATAGDAGALKPLPTHSHERLCRYIMGHIPRDLRSFLDAEDIAQETHIEVFRRIRRSHLAARARLSDG